MEFAYAQNCNVKRKSYKANCEISEKRMWFALNIILRFTIKTYYECTFLRDKTVNKRSNVSETFMLQIFEAWSSNM